MLGRCTWVAATRLQGAPMSLLFALAMALVRFFVAEAQ